MEESEDDQIDQEEGEQVAEAVAEGLYMKDTCYLPVTN
jgi:hypothetical protein